ncbi:MAG: PspA/IM30 family protein [Gammaproteobacteria bacterium]|nr:PspA/IM30 family protein [Gammaproteobacteria bacterium]
MALITRVSRLFRADFHAVLDRIEEPDVLLKQAVREMEEDIARDEQRVKVLTHEQRQLAKRSGDLDDSLQRIEEELDVCFASDKDDLARVLIRRRLETERLRKLLGKKHAAAADTLAELNNRLQENRGRLAAMQQKVELLAEEDSAASDDIWTAPDIAVQDEDVEVAFLREKQKRRRS